MNTELTADEQRQLADIGQFNANHGKGWKLRGRVVRSAAWSGLQLSENSMLDGVVLLGVNLTASRLTDTTFTDVDFSASDLSRAVLERCKFVRCKWVSVQMRATQFKDCSFVDTEANDLNATNAAFTGCRFERFKDEKSLYKDAHFSACEFADSGFQLTSFSRCHFDSCGFADGYVENVSFSFFNGKQIQFKQTSLRAVSFGSGSATGFAFDRCELRRLGFNGMTLSALTISNSHVVEELHVVNCVLDGAVIEGSDLFEASFYRSKLGDIRFEKGRLAIFSMKECELSAGSAFKTIGFLGANLGKSVLNGTVFESCAFKEFIVLNGTTLRGVRLLQPRYAKGFEVDAVGVVYDGSDRFPVR